MTQTTTTTTAKLAKQLQQPHNTILQHAMQCLLLLGEPVTPLAIHSLDTEHSQALAPTQSPTATTQHTALPTPQSRTTATLNPKLGYLISAQCAFLITMRVNPDLAVHLLPLVPNTAIDGFIGNIDVLSMPKPVLGNLLPTDIALPTTNDNMTANSFCNISYLTKCLHIKQADTYNLLVSSGLLRKGNNTGRPVKLRSKLRASNAVPKAVHDGITYRPTPIGERYIREYNDGTKRYLVYDKQPVLKILRVFM